MTTETPNDTESESIQTAQKPSRRNRRTWLFFALMGVLTLVVFARMIFSAAAGPEHRFMGSSDGTTWQYNVIPALRGRILDVKGRPLAWSERSIALMYEKPELPAAIASDMSALAQLIPVDVSNLVRECQLTESSRIILIQSLKPADIEKLDLKLKDTQGTFRVEQQFVRHIAVNSPSLKAMLGKTWQNGRRQVGISGLERKYNQELTGEDGYYRVMTDKNGNWIPGTWEELRKPRPGFDKYIDVNLDSLPGS